jgi:hypothetical protein
MRLAARELLCGRTRAGAANNALSTDPQAHARERAGGKVRVRLHAKT